MNIRPSFNLPEEEPLSAKPVAPACVFAAPMTRSTAIGLQRSSTERASVSPTGLNVSAARLIISSAARWAASAAWAGTASPAAPSRSRATASSACARESANNAQASAPARASAKKPRIMATFMVRSSYPESALQPSGAGVSPSSAAAPGAPGRWCRRRASRARRRPEPRAPGWSPPRRRRSTDRPDNGRWSGPRRSPAGPG